MSKIQIVNKNSNPSYYSLIENFYSKTSIPLLINTSLNLKGEPAANSPKDAYSIFKKSGLDILILEDYVLKKIKLIYL